MADPEPLARLNDKGRHAVEVLLKWVAEERTGELTFHFYNGDPNEAERSFSEKLGGGGDADPLTVLD